MTIENNEKNERYVAGCFLVVTLMGCIFESIFYNYPLISAFGLQQRLNVLMRIYESPNYWLKNGIYWRTGLLASVSALVWITEAKHKPDEKATPFYVYTALGLVAVLCCHFALRNNHQTSLYLTGNIMELGGMMSFITGVTGIRRILRFGNKKKTTNKLTGQTTELINTPVSINWETEDGYVNITNPFRGIVIVGGPGAGKSYTLIEPIIDQEIEKGFTGMIYDFKFPTLGRFAYNMMIKHEHKTYYNKQKTLIPTRQFYCINFKDVRYSHRCNPIDPKIMESKTQSDEIAMTVMLNLEKSWISKRDFFANSAIALMGAILWFLRKYAVRKNKNICTLPHAVQFALSDTEKMLTILSQDPEAMTGAAPILEAFNKGAMEQLAGQIASLQIPIAKLAIKELFWVMTGNDFTLDLNNPEEPKIVIIGNDDKLSQVYAPALSLYCTVIAKTINQANRLPSFFTVDEIPTVFLPGIDNLPNTGRSNKVSFCMAMQDYGQLDRDYGKDQARVLKAGCGNVFIGEVSDEATAKYASAMMGKERQEQSSITISKNDVTKNINDQLNQIIPENHIMQLKTGEFVGKVAEVDDDRKDVVNSKLFASKFLVDKTGNPDQDIPTIFNIYDNLPEGEDKGTLKTEKQLIDLKMDQHYRQIALEIEELIFDEYEVASIRNIMKKEVEYRQAYKYIEENNVFEEVFHDVNTRFKDEMKKAEDQWLDNKRNDAREKETMEEKLNRVTKEYIKSSVTQYFTKLSNS